MKYVTVQPLCSRHDRSAEEGLAQHVDHAVAWLFQRVQAGAYDAEIIGTQEGTETA